MLFDYTCANTERVVAGHGNGYSYQMTEKKCAKNCFRVSNVDNASRSLGMVPSVIIIVTIMHVIYTVSYIRQYS